MRIVTDRCRTFEYTVTGASPCAVDLEPSVIGTRRLFYDCLRLTVGVDRGDVALMGQAVRIVRRIAAETDAAQIVVNGFPQLRRYSERHCIPQEFDVLSRLADALDVLTEFAERLEERGERVHLMPFGWNQNCRVEPVAGAQARRVIHISADSLGGHAATSSVHLGTYASCRRQPRWRTSCARS